MFLGRLSFPLHHHHYVAQRDGVGDELLTVLFGCQLQEFLSHIYMLVPGDRLQSMVPFPSYDKRFFFLNFLLTISGNENDPGALLGYPLVQAIGRPEPPHIHRFRQ